MEIAAGSQRLQRGITAGAERLQLGICAAGGIQLHGTVWRLILSFFSIVQYFVAYLLDFTYIPPPAIEMDPFIAVRLHLLAAQKFLPPLQQRSRRSGTTTF
jgi:hypothetical protein